MADPNPSIRTLPESRLRAVQRGVLATTSVLLVTLMIVGETSQIGMVKLAEASMPTIPGGHWLAVVLLIAFSLASAVSVAGETAVGMLRPMHVRHLREKYPKQGDRLQSLLDNQLNAVAACNFAGYFFRLLLILPAMVMAPGLAAFVDTWIGWDPTTYWAVILSGFVLLVFPIGPLVLIVEHGLRTYAMTHPHGATYRLRAWIRGAMIVFGLPARLTTAFGKLVSTRVNAMSPPLANVAEEEIKTLVESAEESGEIEEEAKELLHSVFEFGDTVVREVMTPRVDLDAVPVTTSPEELLAVIKESGHSRIPLYEGTDDQIVGIVHAKDLLMAMVQAPEWVDVRSLARPALFVPENKDLHELLAELRQSRSQMAIVQDEFGGTAGIVTIEDIVEELVGDIVDEYDVEEPEIVPLPEGGWSVEGKTHLDDLNHEIESDFDSEEFDTVGGFVFGSFGRQPRKDEKIEIDGFEFLVTKTDGRRIHRLTIQKLSPTPSGDVTS